MFRWLQNHVIATPPTADSRRDNSMTIPALESQKPI
jgi:hypothetical protein